MDINQWLDSRNIPSLDAPTLEAIKEFIGGSQLALAADALQQSNKHNNWVQENVLSKREQMAGFALAGLTTNYRRGDLHTVHTIRDDAYAVADAMLEEKSDDKG